MTKLKGEEEPLPRLTVELRPDQLRVRNIFSFGQQRAVFSTIVDQLIALHDKHGDMAIAAVQTGDVSIIDLLKVKKDKA